MTRARAGGATATALRADGTLLLVAAVALDGIPAAPVLTLARPLDAAALAHLTTTSGGGLAISDGQRVILASDERIMAEALGGREADAYRSTSGHLEAAAAPIGNGLWMWAIRPGVPGPRLPRSWFWLLASASGIGALALASSARRRRASSAAALSPVSQVFELSDGSLLSRSGGQTEPGKRLRSGHRRSSANALTQIAAGGGLRFGRYTLYDRIGEGGMSEIYAATLSGAEGFQRMLVIKRLKPELARNRFAVDQFIDEAKLGSLLVHSNVVQVFDFGKVEDGYYMALEYIVGRNVTQIVERHVERIGKPLDPPLVFFIAHEVLQGLAYAHARTNDQGDSLLIVHRDVSPGNVIAASGGEVKLIDFGIVKAEDRVSHTEFGNVKGNPAFMSPEQARGQSVDARSDLFSLGLVMYYALTNELLYKGTGSAETLYKAATGPAAHDLDRIATLPGPAGRVLKRALAPAIADRYQSAEEFVADVATEVSPGAKADLATLLNALFGPELRPQIGAGVGGGSRGFTRRAN